MSESLKVAMLTSWMVKCGVATYSYELTKALAQLDVETYVVCLNRFGQKDPEYYEYYAREIPKDVDLVHVQHEYSLYSWQEETFYRSLLEHFSDAFGKKLPIVTTMHAAGLNFRSDDTVSRFNDVVIVHNQYCANIFKHPCHVIPMGCKPLTKPLPDANDGKKRWGVKPDTPTIGMFGFLTEYKGLELAVDVIEKIPDAELLLGGGWHIDVKTPYIQKLQSYAYAKAQRRVKFLGYVDDEDLPLFFSACDVIIIAHRFITESMALTAALSHEKPVLAVDLNPFKEKEELGTLVTFHDVNDLLPKAKALLADEELRRNLSEAAKKYAEDNSWSKIAEKHKKLYLQLTHGENEPS